MDTTASCLPSGEIAASSTPFPGFVMSDTKRPLFQSAAFGENAGLSFFSRQRAMPNDARRWSGALTAWAMISRAVRAPVDRAVRQQPRRRDAVDASSRSPDAGQAQVARAVGVARCPPRSGSCRRSAPTRGCRTPRSPAGERDGLGVLLGQLLEHHPAVGDVGDVRAGRRCRSGPSRPAGPRRPARAACPLRPSTRLMSFSLVNTTCGWPTETSSWTLAPFLTFVPGSGLVGEQRADRRVVELLDDDRDDARGRPPPWRTPRRSAWRSAGR